jgi:glycosyltransferase involved in cell wall biosynthesis
VPRVGISLLTLVPRISGGSETYARELVRALGHVGRHDYRALLPSIAADVEGVPAEFVTAYRASASTPGRVLAMVEGALRGRRLEPWYRDLDVVHFPLTITIPRVDHPSVTTVLDLQHEHLPEFFSRPERTYRRLAYRAAANRCERVVTISRHAARDIVERLGVAEERVHPIHLGLDHSVFRPGTSPREGFLLYPARPWPHKNHARLFEAFGELRRRRPGLELVLTAYDGVAPDGVRTLGHVSRDELVGLYQRAAALVFPSMYEGFGQPPLEAMACGCPVASSNAASLPEVCGDAARLFDPTSVDELIDAVEDVLDDPEPWRARGLTRASEFSWDATARAHDDVYAELVGRTAS